MQRAKLSDDTHILLIRIEEAPTLERSIVTPAHMHPQTKCLSRVHDPCHLLFHFLVKGKERQDFRLVFQEEVIPTGIPSSHPDHPSGEHHLLLMAILGTVAVETHGGDQSPLGGILSEGVGGEVMVRCMTDMEPRILIAEAHRHRRAPMLTAPGIHMPIL